MMFSRRWFLPATLLGAMLSQPAARSADDSFRSPDSLVLKDGRVIRGLIIRNSVDAVLMQEEFSEKSYPKSSIVRIRDEADIGVSFTDINRKGDLPAWRVIANDLRTHDEIKSLREIPATLIDNGEFKNVPYKSFRVNENIEMNVYGDPDNPAGLEIGIYGTESRNDKLRRTLRAYIAGFLTTRGEVATLYGLSFAGEIRPAGNLILEITPKDAPDAYGAWWISIYNKEKLAEVRLDQAEYARLVRPMDEVIDKKGRVIANGWNQQQMNLSEKVRAMGDSAPVLMRGFFRDKNGDFRLLTEPAASRTN